MKTNVKWGLSVKIITVTGVVLLLGAMYLLTFSLFRSKDWITLIPVIIILGLLVYYAWEAPLSLELTDSCFILHKPAGRFTIDIDQISEIEIYKPARFEIRLLGSGGMFGYIGKFKNATIGTYQSFVGDYAQSFRIQTKDGKNYVFSCNNRDLMVDAIKKQIQ